MKVYIAASSAEIERAERWAARMTEAGIDVVSTWPQNIRTVGDANPRNAGRSDRSRWSSACLREILSCDLLWLLAPDAGAPTRGAWVEFGFVIGTISGGLGRNRRLLVSSGDTKQSVFCALGREFSTDEDAGSFIVHRHRTVVESLKLLTADVPELSDRLFAYLPKWQAARAGSRGAL